MHYHGKVNRIKEATFWNSARHSFKTPLCSSLKGLAMRKHIRTSLALLVVALAAASFMLMLPGCTGGTNDSPGKPDAVGNRSADGASEATQGDIVSTAMVAYANGDQVLFVDQETQTPYIPTEIDDATIIVDGQQTDEEALVAGNIVQVTGNGIMLESYPGQYPGITKVEVVETGSPADAEQYADIVDTVFAAPDQSQVRLTGSGKQKTAKPARPRLMGLPPTEAVR